jgi:hypothetical protein
MELAPSVYCDGTFFAKRADNRNCCRNAGDHRGMERGQQRRSVRGQHSSEQGLSIEPPSDQPERLVFF